MDKKIIEIEKLGKNVIRGDSMDIKQISLMIINDRLYKMGIITKSERDKIQNEIKLKEYNKY